MKANACNTMIRNCRLAPKLNDGEREALARAAGREGVSMSEWLRNRACDVLDVGDPLGEARYLDDTLRILSQQVNRLLANVRQVKRLHIVCYVMEVASCHSAYLAALRSCEGLMDEVGLMLDRLEAVRTIDLQIRLTEAELAAIVSNADCCGQEPADYLRSLIRSDESFPFCAASDVLARGAELAVAAIGDLKAEGGRLNEFACRLNVVSRCVGDDVRARLELEAGRNLDVLARAGELSRSIVQQLDGMRAEIRRFS